jgi:bisanhydrobacterioruberin hydratase
MAGTYVFTFWAEAAGVATGQIFGEYTYGPTLGWAWRGVPLLIAFNWVLVVHGAFCLSGRIGAVLAGDLAQARDRAATGVVAVIFDFLMEPVAIRLDYWRWAGDAVPLQNYVAWFAIAALSAVFHPQVACSSREMCSAGRLAGVYVVLQMVYFLALRGMWHFQGA